MQYTTILSAMTLLFASLVTSAQAPKEPLPVPVKDSPEGLVKEMIASLKAMTTNLKGVTDAPSATKAIPSIEARVKESRDIEGRMEKLEPPTPELQKKLKDIYEPLIIEAATGFEKEMTRLKAYDYGKPVIKRIEELTAPPVPPKKEPEPVKK